MEAKEVIARDSRGRPLKRLMLEIQGDKGFICHPTTREDCANGRAYPVGFPLVDLFCFDERIFSRLESAVRRRDKRAIASIWAEAQPVVQNIASD
jgi:hypothetical protein